MNRALAIEFSRVTEAAALAAYTWLGRGNKNAADEAAVKAMRYMLNLIHMDGEIVIGEGKLMKPQCFILAKKWDQVMVNSFLLRLIRLMAHE